MAEVLEEASALNYSTEPSKMQRRWFFLCRRTRENALATYALRFRSANFFFSFSRKCGSDRKFLSLMRVCSFCISRFLFRTALFSAL